MISAGVLIAAEGLDDASQGVVVDYSSQPPVVTDGPYGEIRRVASIDEFPQDNEWIKKERAWREATGRL